MDLMQQLEALTDNEGLTLKDYKPITYRSGWQVADHGKECYTVKEAFAIISEMYGNAGVWYSAGVYYIDHSFRVDTKTLAVKIGKACNQQSILRWRDMSLIWLV